MEFSLAELATKGPFAGVNWRLPPVKSQGNSLNSRVPSHCQFGLENYSGATAAPLGGEIKLLL
jgi:hypothetical protein